MQGLSFGGRGQKAGGKGGALFGGRGLGEVGRSLGPLKMWSTQWSGSDEVNTGSDGWWRAA